MKKLAIITTHPIQYNAPLFELLTKRNLISLKVFYTWGETAKSSKYDPDFDLNITWDIPLLSNYDYVFVKNISSRPGSHHFLGIVNPDLLNIVEEFRPDAILVYGWAFHSHFKLIRHFKNKIPVFFRGDSTLLDHVNPLKKLLKKLILSFVYRRIDYALYAGQSNYDYFRFSGVPDRALIFAPHAIDNRRFMDVSDVKLQSSLEWRNRLGIAFNEFVFLYCGKFTEKKNILFLIDAFKLAGFTHQVHLVLVGNGPDESKIVSSIKSESNIHHIPFQNQSAMPSIYHMADVYVLPSKGPAETWGLSVNEAMAAGKPVLVSNKSGAAYDLVKDSINGYIFNPTDLNDLSQKLQLIYSRKNDIDFMKQASKAIINDYSLEKLAEVVENVVIYQLN